MGSKCYTNSEGFDYDEHFGRHYEAAGVDLGYEVIDSSDRGDGGAGGFDGPGDLGGRGEMFPPAPASLSDPSGQAADGGALPGMSEWPLPGATGARGAVSPSHDARSAGGIPLHRQPLAPPGGQLGDHATQSLSQNESSQVSTWIRGPPVASPVEQSVDINRRPVRSPAVGIGRGMRNVRSMADAIHPECIRASHGRSSTLARDPPGGDTSRPDLPREGARPRLPSLSLTTDPRAYDAHQCATQASHRPRPTHDYPRPAYDAPPRVCSPNSDYCDPDHNTVRPTYRSGTAPPSRVPHHSVRPHDPPYDVVYSAPPPSALTAPPAPYGHREHRDYAQGDPTLPPFGQGYELSRRIPSHVEPKTAYKALNGEFVHLETFLDCNANEYEAVECNVDSLLRPFRPRKMITSLYKWMQAWGHYEVTLVSRYGLEMYYELASYRSFILSLTDKYKVPFILTYDERHRTALGRARSFEFSSFNHQLFVTIFDVNSLRTSSKCAKCASLEHVSKDCPFRGAAPSGGVTNQSSADRSRAGRQNVDPDEVCIRFQDGTCKFKKCPCKHCCLLCGGPNGAKSCGNCASKARSASTS